MYKNIFAILICSLISASCAMKEIIYNPSLIDESKLAHIKMKEDNYTVEGKLGTQIQSWIKDIYDERGVKIIDQEALESTRLPEGNYFVVGHCYYTGNYAYPKIPVSLEAGETYYAICDTVTEKDPIFRWDLIKGWKFRIEKEERFEGQVNTGEI